MQKQKFRYSKNNLVDNGVDINKIDNYYGNTPLLYACDIENLDIVK